MFLVLSMVVWVLIVFWEAVVVDFLTFLFNFSGLLLPLTGTLMGHMVHHGGDSWRGLGGA